MNPKKTIRSLANPAKARILQGFFKTGKGEYGEGDAFLGVTVPAVRKLARQFQGLNLREVRPLLRSRIHEERLLALLILILKFQKSRETDRKRIFAFYCRHRRYINNWDLVDVSAPHIVGAHLVDRDRSFLRRLASSRRLWDRRIAVLSTFAFIRRGQYRDTLVLARKLLQDPEDLMHKAIGWMLREIGNRAPAVEKEFLRRYCREMPRTMLRYAIERFPPRKRKAFLQTKAVVRSTNRKTRRDLSRRRAGPGGENPPRR
jgi:3-methyladenine DNA glycosylase AlkD